MIRVAKTPSLTAAETELEEAEAGSHREIVSESATRGSGPELDGQQAFEVQVHIQESPQQRNKTHRHRRRPFEK